MQNLYSLIIIKEIELVILKIQLESPKENFRTKLYYEIFKEKLTPVLHYQY